MTRKCHILYVGIHIDRLTSQEFTNTHTHTHYNYNRDSFGLNDKKSLKVKEK